MAELRPGGRALIKGATVCPQNNGKVVLVEEFLPKGSPIRIDGVPGFGIFEEDVWRIHGMGALLFFKAGERVFLVNWRIYPSRHLEPLDDLPEETRTDQAIKEIL